MEISAIKGGTDAEWEMPKKILFLNPSQREVVKNYYGFFQLGKSPK